MAPAPTRRSGNAVQLPLVASAAPVITIRVAGLPQPQGSKVGRISGQRIDVRGRMAVVSPRVVLTEQADMGGATLPPGRLKAWRKRVHGAAFVAWRDAHGGRSPDPWECAVELAFEFVLPRPESDWLASGKLRKGARAYPTTKPDLSKLVRAVEDSLAGVVYRDDAQVCRYGESGERYAGRGGTGGAVITARALA